MRRVCLLKAALIAVLLSGCGEKPTAVEDIGATEITFPNSTKIMAETMRRKEDLERGMMFREALPAGRGMLFVYRSEANLAYWMYQTKIPLDIIWMDRRHRIVEISANTPPCPSKSPKDCPAYGGHEKAQCVLEVNAGVAAKDHLRVGDVLDF